MYEVIYQRTPSWYPAAAEPDITNFADPQMALAHALHITRQDAGPYYMVRIHNTDTDEWLTPGQLDLRLNGDVMRRPEFWGRPENAR
jgi:hypothetical protein